MSVKRFGRGVAILAGAALLAAACGGDDAGDGAASTTAAGTGSSAAAGASGGAAFEQLVERAKEEGQVVFYTGESNEVLEAYAKGFEDEYGIEVVTQLLTQGPMQERLAQEFQAGKIQADVAGNTLDPAWNETAAADGHLADLTGEELPNIVAHPAEQKGQYFVVNRLNPIGVLYNTDLVKEEDLPETYAGLPAMTDWKGRVAIVDTKLGGALHETHFRLHQEMGEAEYEKFVQGLVGDLDASVSSAISALVAQVGAGELAAIVGIPASLSIPSINAGIPAQIYYPEPVTIYRSSLQALANGPHPNAAKLFINWMLSEDGAKASCSNGVCKPPHMDVEGQLEFPDTAGFVDGKEARKFGDEYVDGLVDAAANS
jgi:iron(III) transport system substrate-binding protein